MTFYSNYLTHHQIPFSNEIYSILNNDYTFVSTIKIKEWNKEQGWDFEEGAPYEQKAYLNDTNYHDSLALARECDVALFGSAPDEYFFERMHQKKEGITFRYSERIYKRGRWRALSPRGILRSINTYYRYQNQNLYLLCAGGYVSGDYQIHGCYHNRCYKWGYFPELKQYCIPDLMNKKNAGKLRLLWCGRFIDWKHPEVVLQLAKELKDRKIDYELRMIGTGELMEAINFCRNEYGLENFVTLLGAIPSEKVRNEMEEAEIFICTSDYQEGWGAVINEAMNSGCAVIASHAMGAAPFLIKDGVNGYIYRNGDSKQLRMKTMQLINNRELRIQMGMRAYETIATQWNAKVASQRFFQLIEDLKRQGYCDRFLSGPCSKAEILHHNWDKTIKRNER